MGHTDSLNSTGERDMLVSPITPEDLSATPPREESGSSAAPEDSPPPDHHKKNNFSASLLLPHAQFSLPKTVHGLSPRNFNMMPAPSRPSEDDPGQSNHTLERSPARGV
eukprot:scaffold546746_cov31-Prasinocladus_malaysianus.AAC.1